MRLLLTITLLIATLTGVRAEKYRKWTESDSKRQIEAKIIDKKLDDSEAKFLTSTGKRIWIDKGKLIPEDRKYIENWVKPVDHISARVVGSGKGWKNVKIVAVAGSRPLVVKAYWREIGKQKKGYPKVFKLKKGEEKTVVCRVGNNYTVKGFVGRELVEEEKWNRKTGL